MELDEIKKSWSELNQRLEKTEVLNKRLINEMLNTRHQSAKDKLMRFEVAFLILCIVFTGFTIASSFAGFYALSTIIILSSVFVLCGLWQVYKIVLLNRMHIDTCSTTELLQKAIRFKVITRMRTVVGLILIVPLFVLLVVLDKNLNNTAVITGVVVGASVGLSIGLLLFFKKMKNIDSLIKSYKDLKDFDNE
jgi:O-antigen/teichoic acid export membrane protein